MNEIINYLNPEKTVGYDANNQLWHMEKDAEGSTISRIVPWALLTSTCYICKAGWTTSTLLDYTRGSQCVDRPVHLRCYEGHLAITEAEMLYSCIRSHYATGLDFVEIPNGYGGGYNTPWRTVKLFDYAETITFGARRRVYNLQVNFEPTNERVEAVHDAFKSVQDTKGYTNDGKSYFVHCWGEAQVRERMGMLFAFLRVHGTPVPSAEKVKK